MTRNFVGHSIGAVACAALLFIPAAIQSQSAHPTSRPGAASTHSPARADVARFHARVAGILSESHAKRASWGILIVDRDTGATLFEMNSDHFFAPASNAKLFTTAAALATLGADYKFHTTLESNAKLSSNGTLDGELALVGRGDPDLSNRKIPYAVGLDREGPTERVLAELADAAVAAGLKEVDGDIVADDSYFPYDPYPADWTLGDIFFRFGAPVSAIAFNENAMQVEISPGVRMGDPATVVTQPGAASGSFNHEVATGPADGEPDLAVVRQPGEKFLLLRGTVPFGHAPVMLDLSMTAPAETAALALKQLLAARGIRVHGGIRVRHAPPPETSASGEPILTGTSQLAPQPDRAALADHISAPLLEAVRITNKISQNLHAELLLRAVGYKALSLGSTAAGLKVERDFLRQAGIADGDVVLSDGSGLSREDLVTPRAVVGLLQYCARQTWGEDYISTLPVAGVDGTLENRMVNTAAASRIQAKTGEIEHARGLSGFATTVRGERLIFSIFYNNNPQKGLESVAPIDQLAVAMVEALGTGQTSTKHR